MYILAVTSPTCVVSPQSATGNQQVTFTCSVTVCGSASVPLTITRGGSSEATGQNTATWQTTADNVMDTDVKCLADVGNAVKCPDVTTSKCMLFLLICMLEVCFADKKQ